MYDRKKPRFSRRSALILGGCTAISAVRPLRLLGSQRQRQVAITIDDGPATGARDDLGRFQRISSGIREAFVAEGVPAIMFINEQQLHQPHQRDARTRVVDQWLQAGLELGNHTYSHQRLRNIELQEFYDEIIKGEVISKQLLREHKQPLKWFRYPYLSSAQGEKAAAVEAFLREHDYEIAPVTVDYRDYSFSSSYSRYLRAGEEAQAEELFASVLRALDHSFAYSEERSTQLLGYELPQVLLIHCNEMNALTLPKTIRAIRNRGYDFVRLDQAMHDAAYRTPGFPPGAMGGRFFNGLAQARSGGAN